MGVVCGRRSVEGAEPWDSMRCAGKQDTGAVTLALPQSPTARHPARTLCEVLVPPTITP